MKRPLPFLLTAISILLWGAGCGGTPEDGTASCVAGFDTEVAGDEASLLSNQQLAQPFVLSGDANPSNMQIRLKGVGALSGTITLTIESSNNISQPDNTPLATATLSAASISVTNEAWYTFTFSTAPTLVRNTLYWIHVRNTALTGGARIDWMGNDTNAYSGGSALISADGITWNAGLGSNRDLLFLIGC